jgi:hypothetical protein
MLDMAGLLSRVPLSERTIRAAIKKRQLPCIRLPGARKFIFHWPTMQEAFRRFEQGGDR